MVIIYDHYLATASRRRAGGVQAGLRRFWPERGGDAGQVQPGRARERRRPIDRVGGGAGEGGIAAMVHDVRRAQRGGGIDEIEAHFPFAGAHK